MAASQVNLHYPLLLICLISSLMASLTSSTHQKVEMNETARQKQGQGFTVHLIHRDSPLSPLHNPAKRKWERFNDALRRSTYRSSYFGRAMAMASVDSLVVPSVGEYLMNLSIGTPPVPVLGIADTGSDLTWTQCLPCVHCYNQSSPIFNPQRSSTFEPVPCGSPTCYSNLLSSNCASDATCSYYCSYGDNSYTNGVLASETIAFGPHTPSFLQVSIGCGHNNGGSFSQNGSGLIGLGGGGLSLVTQLKSSLGAKFSYCLVPFFDTSGAASKMSFGSKALVSGLPGAVSTPLVRKYPSTFYYLTLESIAIGNQTFVYYNDDKAWSRVRSRPPPTTSSNSNSNAEASKAEADHNNYYVEEEGNIIIDSGTTLTLLPKEFYEEMEGALRREIKAEAVEDPERTLRLCYKNNGEGDIQVPVIKVGFAGAEIKLNPYNTFVRVGDDRVCFAMILATEVAIFGKLAQMDFLVGYDLEDSTVSFKSTDCTSHTHSQPQPEGFDLDNKEL